MSHLPDHRHFKTPVVHYLKCKGAGRKPLEYVGDWPVRGQVYACDLLTHFATGEPHVRIHGFWAQEPYGFFKPWRFKPVATIWLN